MGIALAGEIYMCRARAVGATVEQGKSIAVVELAKSIVSVKSPVRGVITEVNPLLDEHPERVHTDPYGSGWIARVRPGNFAADLPQLAHGQGVAQAMQHYAWLNNIGQPAA